jgi:hypothetical protein
MMTDEEFARLLASVKKPKARRRPRGVPPYVADYCEVEVLIDLRRRTGWPSVRTIVAARNRELRKR